MSPDKLSESEVTHFTVLLTGIYLNCDAMYWDHRSGVLPPEVWDRELSVLRFHIGTPGGKQVWQFSAENMLTKTVGRVRGIESQY